jgi:hypothetical protein
VIKIKKDLQKRLETFLNTYPSQEEYGGFLFANRLGTISDFLAIPNIHSSKNDTYQMPENAKKLAEKIADSRRIKLVAHWHNHPTPAVCSVQDCRAATTWDPLYSVLISPTGSSSYRKEFVWYFYKGIKPEKVCFV